MRRQSIGPSSPIKADCPLGRRNVHRVDKGTCQRCRTAKSMFVIRSVTYCSYASPFHPPLFQAKPRLLRPCFESTVQARFTRQLLPPLQTNPAKLKPSQRSLYRPPRQRRDLLIALSSGAGSMAMLDLLCSGGYVGKGDGAVADKTKGEKEVVWDKGVVVYVEFCGVVPGKDRMEMMRGLAEERGLGFAGLRAEDVFVPGLTGRLGGHGEPEHGSEGISVDLRRPSRCFTFMTEEPNAHQTYHFCLPRHHPERLP